MNFIARCFALILAPFVLLYRFARRQLQEKPLLVLHANVVCGKTEGRIVLRGRTYVTTSDAKGWYDAETFAGAPASATRRLENAVRATVVVQELTKIESAAHEKAQQKEQQQHLQQLNKAYAPLKLRQ